MEFNDRFERESQKEALSKIMEYWKKPKQYNFKSVIHEVEGDWLRLNDSLFYPEGGGQPNDEGLIIFDGKKYSVTDVQKKKKIIWLKVVNHNLNAGSEIYGKIDAKRRETLTRNHTAQHILSAAFLQEIGLDTTRAEIGIKETLLELNKTPTLKQIQKALNSVSICIIANIPVVSKFMEPKSVSSMNIRGGLENNKDVYRLVEIGEYDKKLCGGTHVENTAEIGTIAITKFEGKKIRFITGIDAFLRINRNEMELFSMSRSIGASINKVASNVDELINWKITNERRINKYQAIIAKFEENNSPWIIIGKYQIKVFMVENADQKMILDALGSLNTHQIGCGITSNGIFVLTSGSDVLTQRIVNTMRSKGIKGGGRGKTVMGKITNIEKETVIKLITNAIKN